MKKGFIIFGIFFALFTQQIYSQNAPVSTVLTIVSSGSTAVVPITATNFINIASCNLKLLYNPAIVTVTSVTTGPGLGGSLSTDLNVSGVISLGWFRYPGITLPANTIIFNIACTKVAAGTSAISFLDDQGGNSCIWYDGNFNLLNDIPTGTYYLPGSITFSGSLVADFIANTLTPPKNTTVQFTDLTTGGPTSWTWSFNRPTVTFENGTTANSQNPQVQFTDGGLYTVTLVAQNTGNTDTEIKTDYIRVGTLGLWTGITSTEWATTTNWDNWLVPVSSTEVVIPSSAPFWPVHTGDLTIGAICSSITLNGASEFTVTGNLMINPGASLNITNNGIFKIGGNWTNAWSFNAGAGTVEFIGTNPASVISGGSPPIINAFFNLTISKPGAVLTIQPDIIVNGDLTISP